MATSPELDLVLKLGSGVSWTLVYILVIQRGFQEKTFGMPVTPLNNHTLTGGRDLRDTYKALFG